MTMPTGYARVLPGTEQPDSGPIYRSIFPPARPIPAVETPSGGDGDGDKGESGNPLAGLTLPLAESVVHSFAQSASKFADLPCLGTRVELPSENGEPRKAGDFEFITYRAAGARVARVARGLARLELLPRAEEEEEQEEEGERMVGIYMKNSADWVVCEQAAYANRAVVVALYDSLGADSTRFILNQTRLATVVCSRLELRKLVAVARGGSKPSEAASDGDETNAGSGGGVPSLKNVVLTGERDAEAEAEATVAGLRVLHLDEVETAGAVGAADKEEEELLPLLTAPHPPLDTPPRGSDVATIMYTSGTTGDPKGVVLTHAAIMSSCAATMDLMATSGRPFSRDTVYLSFLPLAHIYERSAQVALMASGARVGFSRGSAPTLMEDVAALRPTVLCAVPRLLNRLHDAVMAKMHAPDSSSSTDGSKGGASLRSRLFSVALKAKLRRLARRGQHEHAFWDRLLFRRVKQALGLDRCWLILSGSAPLSPEVAAFLRIAFVCLVVEGYGQTETCGGVTSAAFRDTASGHVGSPNTGAELKLVSVPDMHYLVSDREHAAGCGGGATEACLGRGEVCVRGPLLFRGYYKQPERTREAVDADGWLHTGDIGLWSPLGQLRVIDRRTNLLKLSQGEFVSPERVESALATCPTLAQVFVTGDSLHSHLVAIAVPDAAALTALAKANGFAHLSAAATSPEAAGELLRALCDLKPLRELVLQEMAAASARARLAGFERVRAVHLHHEPFSVDNGLLTPTFKLRRADAQRAFRAHVDALYRESGDRVGGH